MAQGKSNGLLATNSKPKGRAMKVLTAKNVPKKRQVICDANATSSPLLRLPPEIRNCIWSLVLACKTIHMRGGTPLPFRCHVCVSDTTEYEDATALKAETALTGSSHATRHWDCHRAHGFPLGVLQVCREIHQEAALLPYHANTFVFATLRTLMSFLKKLIPAQARAVRRIALVNPCDALPGLAELVRNKLTGLERLTCFVEMATAYAVDSFAREENRRKDVAAAIFQFERAPRLREAAVLVRSVRAGFAVPRKLAEECGKGRLRDGLRGPGRSCRNVWRRRRARR
ncbi:hypothetical protein LTR85_000122 [Meristemomyces frigidus]|nr:hypothetical protein LTR85_000122 [Meristemomyces frigidus]